jgi:glycosyltransferase involved in cell wall biosynthesis
VVVRPFSPDNDRLSEDLLRASVLLMPSRTEGFGLVGLEAITAGTPALISARSGLGMLLRDTLPAVARPVVVPVGDHGREDVQRWGHHLAAVLRDPAGALVLAQALQREMAKHRTWAMAADAVLTHLAALHTTNAGGPAQDA